MAYRKQQRRKIAKNINVVYELICEEGEYSFSCFEYDDKGVITDECLVRSVTVNRSFAEEIFEKLVNNKVCACTLKDIICDLIC